MTVIAGLVDHGEVWIGADSWGGNEYGGFVRKDSKLFRCGAFLLGYTSSFRMGQLLEHELHPPTQLPGVEDVAFMVTAFIGAVRDCLKAGGFAKKENEVEEGGRFLVAYRGELYRIDSDYHVGRPRCGFSSIGAGMDFALGSLHSTKGPPRTRIRKALEAAETFNNNIRGPFTIRKAP